jgi:hypothetical protein
MSSKVYEIVTDKIIAALESGTPPRRKPWTAGIPRNAITDRPYSGINAPLLGMTTYSDPRRSSEDGQDSNSPGSSVSPVRENLGAQGHKQTSQELHQVQLALLGQTKKE